MIVERKNVNGVLKIIVEKDFPDERLEVLQGSKFKKEHMSFLLQEDADVYTKDGKLLLRFRKAVLPAKHVELFYDNVISHALKKTRTRGTTSGSKKGARGRPEQNKKVMSNILGFYDKWSLGQKHIFKTLDIKPPFEVHETNFTERNPEKWQHATLLIKDIDRMYKKLVPSHYAKQRALADDTAFKIENTAFTTVTTNVNFQTSYHFDKGDFQQGFGNLVVIEKGAYEGGYTVFPQFGVGVDVRTGDFLAMDVHQLHGNVGMLKKSKDAVRMSIVCYLRQDVYNKTKGSTAQEVLDCRKIYRIIRENFKQKHATANVARQLRTFRSSAP
jgi:hypothetical protein